MNKYELVYVIDTTLDDDARKAVMDRFHGMLESLGGKVEKVEEWGKRRLAYPINDKNDGYYVLMTFTSAPSFPLELDRIFRITDGVVRSLIVCKDE
ncbi:MAG: 30S ribosomal protein S6 [Eubacteriales bacterium]|nr:30S ribosomal protein S6 [Eubacteriales bacterium]